MIQFDDNLKDASATIYRAYRAIDLLEEEKRLTDKERQLGLLFIAATLREAIKKVETIIGGVYDENC